MIASENTRLGFFPVSTISVGHPSAQILKRIGLAPFRRRKSRRTHFMSADNGLTENTYEYDANGNREDENYDVGDGNRLTTDGVWNYFYDNEGNLIKRVNVTETEDAGITWTYAYDHANHLTQAKLWDSDPDENEEAVLLRQADYVYDVFGNRIEKIVDWDGEGEDPAEVLKFAYDGWNNIKSSSPVGNENWDVIADLDGAGSLITRYMRGDAVDQLFASVANDGDTLWNLTDQQGSVRDVIDNSGAVLDTITYDGFGNFTESDPEFGGRYKWTSREFDTETNLQYNRRRYYDAETGRWISQDPLGFDAGDSNLYRYVNNRPTIATDPSGLQNPIQQYLEAKEEAKAAFWKFGLYRAKLAKKLADLALKTTEIEFNGMSLHNTFADAWRHCFWSALMSANPGLAPGTISSELGKLDGIPTPATTVSNFYDFAYQIGYDHEQFNAKDGQPQIEYAMDMHNNNVGLQIGSALGPNATTSQLMKACDRALYDGRLIWIINKNTQLTDPAVYYENTRHYEKSLFNISYYPVYYTIKTDLAGNPIQGPLKPAGPPAPFQMPVGPGK